MSGIERWVDQAIRSQLNQSSLSEERERILLAQSRNGATEALRHAATTQLWGSHAKLVVAIANRFRRPDMDLLDLVGAGHLGLHAAISGFDPARANGRLAPYAAAWIRWSIRDYIRRNASSVRLPESRAHRQLAQFGPALVRDARNSCRRECIEETTAAICERVGARIGLDPQEVERGLRLLDGGVLSLQGSDALLEQTLPDEAAPSEDEVISRLDREKARNRMVELAQAILGERERAVFLSRCLGDAAARPSLDELAARFGVTAERIHQLEGSARKKIATVLAGEGFREAVPVHQPQPPPRRGPDRRRTPVQRHPVARTVLTA